MTEIDLNRSYMHGLEMVAMVGSLGAISE